MLFLLAFAAIAGIFTVLSPRISPSYQPLLPASAYGKHQLSIKILQGVKAYAFTFGTE